MTKVALGGRAIQRAVTRVKFEQASKELMQTPTRLLLGGRNLIPHADLLKSVARRIVDRNVLWLIKLWLRAPVEERDGNGTRRMSGGKSNKRGTPQGGVASPLLSVIYMNRFLKHWRLTKRGEAFYAHVVSYADADDCVPRTH